MSTYEGGVSRLLTIYEYLIKSDLQIGFSVKDEHVERTT